VPAVRPVAMDGVGSMAALYSRPNSGFGGRNVGFRSPVGEHHYSIHYLNLMTNPMILMFVSGAVIAKIYQSNFVIENRVLLCLMIIAAVSLIVLQYERFPRAVLAKLMTHD
jgi:hypothetical protein